MSMIYVVQVSGGSEFNVVNTLLMKEIRAYAPRQELLERRKGIWNTVRRYIFPGYVFAETELTAVEYYLIRETEGVLKILGNPTPLSYSEEHRLRWIFESGMIGVNKGLVSGGTLTITDGLLKGREAEIVSYSIRQKRCRLCCKINGRKHFFSISAEIEKL